MLEENTYKLLLENSKLFLCDGIERLVNQDSTNSNSIEPSLLKLTCASFQISLELAFKAIAVKHKGIKSIATSKHRNISSEELKNLIASNNFKTIEFNQVKNLVKSNKLIKKFNRLDFKIISEFQLYRNRIVHFNYEFNHNELHKKKEDLIYYMLQIIFKVLLSDNDDIKPSEFVEFSLKKGLHKKLIEYAPYIEAMKRMCQEFSNIVYTCVHCFNKTYSKIEEYCYCCNIYFDDYSFINCENCNSKESIIFDELNIELNNNISNSMCLNCGLEGSVFKCPICNTPYELSFFANEICNDKTCIN